MTHTLQSLQQESFIQKAVEQLNGLLSDSQKTYFEIVAGPESHITPCRKGYLITIDYSQPHADIILLHEILHGILLEEGYPTAYTGEQPDELDIIRGILWDFTNCIHHVEIFRRMREVYHANVDHYFKFRSVGIQQMIDRRVQQKESQFAIIHMDVLVLFDTFLMGEEGTRLQEQYRNLAERPLMACQEIHKNIATIGCKTPQLAMDSANQFQAVMTQKCRYCGPESKWVDFWRSIQYCQISERDGLAECPNELPDSKQFGQSRNRNRKKRKRLPRCLRWIRCLCK